MNFSGFEEGAYLSCQLEVMETVMFFWDGGEDFLAGIALRAVEQNCQFGLYLKDKFLVIGNERGRDQFLERARFHRRDAPTIIETRKRLLTRSVISK